MLSSGEFTMTILFIYFKFYVLFIFFPFFTYFVKRNEMSNFMDSIDHPLAHEVVSYYCLIAPLPWTTTQTQDCGMYLAYFMEHYEGDYKELKPINRVSITSLFFLC